MSDKLEQTQAIIGEYQEKTRVAQEELAVTKELLKTAEQEKEELSKQAEGRVATIENNQALIVEYKEKIDTLSGLVNKYQEYQEENEMLKEQFAQERKQLQSQVAEVMKQNVDKQNEVKELKRELERTIEKKDFEKEKALLELERQNQAKLQHVTDNYNKQIQELYSEMNALRKEYDEKNERLQQANNKGKHS